MLSEVINTGAVVAAVALICAECRRLCPLPVATQTAALPHTTPIIQHTRRGWTQNKTEIDFPSIESFSLIAFRDQTKLLRSKGVVKSVKKKGNHIIYLKTEQRVNVVFLKHI